MVQKKFLNSVCRVTKLPFTQIRSVALSTLQRNAYFVNPENVLLKMVGDDAKEIQRLAINKITTLQKSDFHCHIPINDFEGDTNEPQPHNSQIDMNIRLFQIPVINIKAKSFHQIVNIIFTVFNSHQQSSLLPILSWRTLEAFH